MPLKCKTHMNFRKIILLLIVFMGACSYPHKMYYARSGNPKTLLDTCNSKECLTQLIKINPDNVEAHWWLGTKYQAEHNYTEAITEFNKAIELDSSYNLGFPYRDRANCKNNLSDDLGAVMDMDVAIRNNPEERYFYYDRGTYLYNLNKYDMALNDFNKALEIWSKFDEARVWKAKLLVQLKNYKEAIIEYETLNISNDFITNPNNAYDIYYRGLAYFNVNSLDKACTDWKASAPNCEEAKIKLEKYCK